ncbi:MAG: hypothetical protein JXA82_01485 [Sedimentisphaerales bacterium]|nr:hypothetical protein [Sedimentisphaerales bacterium]
MAPIMRKSFVFFGFLVFVELGLIFGRMLQPYNESQENTSVPVFEAQVHPLMSYDGSLTSVSSQLADKNTGVEGTKLLENDTESFEGLDTSTYQVISLESMDIQYSNEVPAPEPITISMDSLTGDSASSPVVSISSGSASASGLSGSGSGTSGVSGGNSSSSEPSNSPKDSEDQNTSPSGGSGGGSVLEKPEIIWCYGVGRHPLRSMQIAVDSGFITNVIMAVGNRETSDQLYKHYDTVQQAVAITKQADIKLTLVRYMWPSLPEAAPLSLVFDLNHYLREIDLLKQEARQINADYIGFDLEPYNSTEIRQWISRKRTYQDRNEERLRGIVWEVIKRAGKVDYVYPAGSMSPYNPYNTLALLGKNRIAESTYYNNPTSLPQIKYPYEIFGAYLNTTTTNEYFPGSPYFLVEDIFESSDLWSKKKGLFMYPKEDKAQEVADALLAYRDRIPIIE